MTATQTTITTLDDLYRVLTQEPNTHETADRYGLPRDAHRDAIDLTSLPTFGGQEPARTEAVFSWDATRLLVYATPLGGLEPGNALRNQGGQFRIVPR
jgi:hypothetical protein